MDKPDTSHLFDAKMELHPEEESFAQPTILLNSKSSNRCNGTRIAGIVVVVGIIAGAFVGGYMVRRAVSKLSKCEKNGEVSPTPSPQIHLQDILSEMSAENIERNLRLVRATVVILRLCHIFLSDHVCQTFLSKSQILILCHESVYALLWGNSSPVFYSIDRLMGAEFSLV